MSSISAADISVSDMHDTGNGDFVANEAVNLVGVCDSGFSSDSGHFNDTVNLDNYKSSKYGNHIVDGSTSGASGVSDGDYKSSNYSGHHIVDDSSNCTSSIYTCSVTCENDFKYLSEYLGSCNKTYDYVLINVDKDIDIKSNGVSYFNDANVMSVNNKDTLFVVNGNNHSIKISNPNNRGGDHFLNCGEKCIVLLNNLVLSGFNSAIVNKGAVTCEGVTFNSNCMNYVNNGLWWCY